MAVTYTKTHCKMCNSSRGVKEFLGLCASCYQDNRAALRQFKMRWCRFCGDLLGAKVRDGNVRNGDIAESMRCSSDDCRDDEWNEANTIVLENGEVYSKYFIVPAR